MKILVCISSVPETTSKINFTNNKTELDKTNMQFVINPYDEFGLTKAIMLKEQLNGEVTVISVGDSSIEPVIRKALAIGADNAIRINKDPKDSYSTAIEIANYINNNSFDLIIAGRESIDYNGGSVPGMIAELANYPFINACIELNINDRNVNATREIDGGKESLSTTLPIIIGGQKGLVQESELKIPNMRGIMQARTKSLQVIESIDDSNLTTSIEFATPEEKAECKYVEATNVKELVDLLHQVEKII